MRFFLFIQGRVALASYAYLIAKLPDKDLHHYDVTITTEVTSRGVKLNCDRANGEIVPRISSLESDFLPMMGVRVYILLDHFLLSLRNLKLLFLMKIIAQVGNVERGNSGLKQIGCSC